MTSLPPVDTTVIVATHNRPDTLRQALRSVAMQRHRAWAAIVVGDACDERTQAVMAEFAHDPRFLYVNLAQRCGEQALPNSAAMQVVGTEFVALLNHDDLWLPDHLTIALERLRSTGHEFFLGRAVRCRDGTMGPDGEWSLQFERASPVDRSWNEAFWQSLEYVEPASSWVLRREWALQVGPWRPAVALYRAPLQEWFLRAWRTGARLVSDPRITCIKFGVHHRTPPGKRSYDSHAAVHEALVRRMQRWEQAPAGMLRDHHGDPPGLPLARPWGSVIRPLPGPRSLAWWAEQVLRWRWVGELYRRRGWDAATPFSRGLGATPGHHLRRMLMRRTGETLRTPPTLQAVVDELLAARHRTPDWCGWVEASTPTPPWIARPS